METKKKNKGFFASLSSFFRGGVDTVSLNEDRSPKSTGSPEPAASKPQKKIPVFPVVGEEGAERRTKPAPTLMPDQYFGLHNGEALAGLEDLERALVEMSHEQFRHHTADGRNDFASWIEGVFGEYELAEKIRSADSREGMHSVLKRYITSR